MTVGILYPSSNAHLDIGVDFIDGIKAFIKKEMPKAAIQLLIEGIGFGGSEKEVYQKSEKLLRIEKADILIAFIDQKVLAVLEPLVLSTGSLLVVVNAGANYPSNWVSQPNIIYLTMHHAFLCSLSGILAAKQGVTKAALATTFFDCGYLHTAAMLNGFMQYQGSISYNYINNQVYNQTFDIKQLTDFLIINKETNKLLCVFDSLPASLFYDRLKAYEDVSNLQLFVSPMMLEGEAVTALANNPAISVQGYKPWQPSLENEYNKVFMEFYKGYAKKEATIFSVLGWEAGLVLQQIMSKDETENNGTAIVEALKNMKLNSPRGQMYLDEETGYLLAPAVKCQWADGCFSTEIISIETIEKNWQAFTATEADAMASGWTNTYLCY